MCVVFSANQMKNVEKWLLTLTVACVERYIKDSMLLFIYFAYKQQW